MRHFRIILGLLLAIIAGTFFSSYTAHAATAHAASQPNWKLVVTLGKSSSTSIVKTPDARLSSSLKSHAAYDGCVQANESNIGWGITYNAYGTQLNLNGIYFGANNTCNVDVINGTWEIEASGTCPANTVGGGITFPTSGYVPFLAAKDFERLFAGSLIFRCIYYNSNGSISDITSPAKAWASFIVYANLSGGTGSSSVRTNYWG